jgi:hypothetical protein
MDKTNATDPYYRKKVRLGLIIPPSREEVYPEEAEAKRLNAITLMTMCMEIIGPERGWFRAPAMDWHGLGERTVRRYLEMLEATGHVSRRMRGGAVETRINALPENQDQWKEALSRSNLSGYDV